MQGVKSIQTKLANLMIRLDDKGQHLDELTKEIRGKHGKNRPVILCTL